MYKISIKNYDSLEKPVTMTLTDLEEAETAYTIICAQNYEDKVEVTLSGPNGIIDSKNINAA